MADNLSNVTVSTEPSIKSFATSVESTDRQTLSSYVSTETKNELKVDGGKGDSKASPVMSSASIDTIAQLQSQSDLLTTSSGKDLEKERKNNLSSSIKKPNPVVVFKICMNVAWTIYLSIAMFLIVLIILILYALSLSEKHKITPAYKDCLEAYNANDRKSDIYLIKPKIGQVFSVSCEMELYGGGWTVLQQQRKGELDFNRTYLDYIHGFGHPLRDHWIGTELMHHFTKDGKHALIILMNVMGDTIAAKFNTFIVGNASVNYKLTIAGYDTNSALGSAFLQFNNRPLSTIDKPHDAYSKGNCARIHNAGFWWNSCGGANINGNLWAKGPTSVFYGDINQGITMTRLMTKQEFL